MKKNLKAIVSIILVLGLLVCLTGCGENEKKQEAIDEFNTTAAAFNEVKDLVNANASEIPEDVIAVCHDVLRHRIGVTYEAEANNIGTDEIITEILDKVQVP